MTAPTQQNPNNFLMGGGGAKSAKFEKPDDTVGGPIIAEPEMRQQTDFKTGKELFWDNGDPRMQLVVRVQTQLREDPEDDGVRAFYIKGGFKRPTAQKAVADAVRAAGAPGLAVGGQLFLTLDSIDGTDKDSPKNYSARYVAPVVGGDFLNTGQIATPPAAAAPAPPAQPAYVPPPVPQAPVAPPALVTLPDGSQVTPEVAALLQQVQPPAA